MDWNCYRNIEYLKSTSLRRHGFGEKGNGLF